PGRDLPVRDESVPGLAPASLGRRGADHDRGVALEHPCARAFQEARLNRGRRNQESMNATNATIARSEDRPMIHIRPGEAGVPASDLKPKLRIKGLNFY